MGRYFGEPLAANGKAIQRPWGASGEQGLKLRQALDEAWTLAGQHLGLSPAEVQERMWAAEQALYHEYGAPRSSGYVSDGVRRGIERVQAGETFERYKAGRPATEGERARQILWKAFSSLRRSLYDGAPGDSGRSRGLYSTSQRVGGYTRIAGRDDLASGDVGRVRLAGIGDGGKAEVVAEYSPNRVVGRALEQIGGRALSFYEISDGTAFQHLVQRAFEEHPLGKAISVHSATDYSNMRLLKGGQNRFCAKRPQDYVHLQR